jgi:hypothetical protein
MKYFCTITDRRFLSRVYALNDSLGKFNKDYKLLTLCIDFDEPQSTKDNIVFYKLNDLLNDTELLKAKNNPPSPEALLNRNYEEAKNVQFVWSLSSYFTNFCINLDFVTEDILYIDADIYFFSDWSIIYNYTKHMDIGLVEHRMPWTGNSGKYNVGIVYFKKNTNGINCSDFWKNCLLNTDHEFYKDYGGCGDQKYLELFPSIFNNVDSFDNYIGHLAPWNLPYHQYIDNKIIWNNHIQDVMYYHFSNFYYDEQSFIPAPRHHIHDVSSVPLLQKLHEEYYNTLKKYA